MSDAGEFCVVLKSHLAKLQALEPEVLQLRAESARYRAQAEHYQSALDGLAGLTQPAAAQPRRLAATCDALRVRMIRLEDEIATKQRELETFREILAALGSLCRPAPAPTPAPLYTDGAAQEDAEEPEERVQWRRSAAP